MTNFELNHDFSGGLIFYLSKERPQTAELQPLEILFTLQESQRNPHESEMNVKY